MKRFIESIIHWHSSCYITLTFLVYFFSTNGLEGTDTCVKTLVGIILGSIIIIIMEHNKIHTIINKNKKRIFLIFPVFILMFGGTYFTSLPKENISQSVLDHPITINIIDATSIEVFHGIVIFTIFFIQFIAYALFITSKEFQDDCGLIRTPVN